AAEKQMAASTAVRFGPFLLDGANQRLIRGERVIALTPKSFAVLAYLSTRAGQLVGKDELLSAVWPDVHVGDAVLKTSVREIRKALGDPARNPAFIETVHRRGYRFIAVTAAPAEHHESPASARHASPGAIGEHAWTRNASWQLVGRDAELARLERCL